MSDASDRHTSGSTGTPCLLRMGRFFFSVSSVLLHLPLPDFLPVLPAVRLSVRHFSVPFRAAPSRLAPADGCRRFTALPRFFLLDQTKVPTGHLPCRHLNSTISVSAISPLKRRFLKKFFYFSSPNISFIISEETRRTLPKSIAPI